MSILRITGECFTVTEKHREAVEGLQLEHRLARCRIRGHENGIDGAIQFLSENGPPNLLVVEVAETGHQLFERLDSLANVCEPGINLILLGRENDIQLYKQLTDIGIGDYLCGEITTNVLLASIERIFDQEGASNLGRVVSFIGSRGGVGSSTLAANTAHALSQLFDNDVILMDLDVAFGSQAMTYNKQPRQHLSDALAEPDRLDDVMVERFMTKYDDKLSIMTAPAILHGDSAIDTESFESVVDLVQHLADFVVLDVPHQWSPWVQDILMSSDEIVITAYPDLVNLRDVKNLLELFGTKRSINAPNRLAFNSVGRAKKSELASNYYEESTKVAPSVTVPFDAGLFSQALNDGQMLSQVGKNSKVVKEINRLAKIVSARDVDAKSTQKKKLSLWRRKSSS